MRFLKSPDWDPDDPIVFPSETNQAEQKVAALVDIAIRAKGLLSLGASAASQEGRKVLQSAAPHDFSEAFRRQLLGRVLDELRDRRNHAQNEVDGVGLAQMARWFDRPQDVVRVCSSAINDIVATRDRWEDERRCVTDDPRITRDRVHCMPNNISPHDQAEWFASVRVHFIT
ncbi:MAG TPA: hypothetical protein VIT68_03250 [Candidatus Gracilibacteria bacterium]